MVNKQNSNDMKLPETTIGMFIRDLRVRNRISLRGLATLLKEKQNQNNDSQTEETKFSAGFLSDIEHGRRFPSPRALELIAQVLNVPVSELEEKDQRMPTEELHRLHTLNPQFGFAFRRAVALINDQSLSPQQVVERLYQQPPQNDTIP